MNKSTYILEEKGIISRKPIKAEITSNQSLGIRFQLPNLKFVSVCLQNLQSTQRNTVLGDADDMVCLVEHFLAAAALTNLNNIDVKLNETELPFGDGSSQFWIDYFFTSGLSQINNDKPKSEDYGSRLTINHSIKITDDNDPTRYIEIKPSNNFSANYRLEQAPPIGKQEFTWVLGVNAISDVSKARTFSSKAENAMLGLDGWVLGYDHEGFDQKLYFDNEPARHKVLDLLGDLMLLGINPLRLNVNITSVKGGHSLNAKATEALLKEIIQ